MNETILGKISEVYFGKQDGRLGLFVTLSGSWSVQTSYVFWDSEEVKVSEFTKWNERDREIQYSDIMRRISELLDQAKVNKIEQLKNIPVEYTSKDGILNNWRILTEVL